MPLDRHSRGLVERLPGKTRPDRHGANCARMELVASHDLQGNEHIRVAPQTGGPGALSPAHGLYTRLPGPRPFLSDSPAQGLRNAARAATINTVRDPMPVRPPMSRRIVGGGADDV